MKRIIKLSLAAAAMLAVICSGAWAANVDANANTKEWTDGNNYIVTGNVTIGDRIRVRGSVTLILNDGCELNARDGISVNRNSSLTIKTPSGSEGTGRLIARTNVERYPGIGLTSGRCDITIAGGNVTAEGGYRGAGISGYVAITGGTVSAKGGDGAAGIGGGDGLAGRTITITGGTVVATGGKGGAGLGGGPTPDALNRGWGRAITITGGTVSATGGDGGAGIGGGDSGSGGNITISGGTVSATGGRWGAGIGGGHVGSGGNITITGGTVTATGGAWAAGISGGRNGGRGTLSSGIDGTAWIVTNGVDADRSGFTSGVLFVDSDGAVYGDQTIDKNVNVPSGKTLKIEGGRKLTVSAGKTLKVNKGATLTLESGGHLVSDGTIVNDGLVRLPEGSDLASFGLSKTDSGVIEIGGKAVTKEPTEEEKKAAKKVIDKIKGDGSAVSGIRAADADPMEADVNDGDILFDTETVEGALCTMSIKVKAEPDQYAIIANGQMVDVAPGSSTDDDMDDDDAPKAKLVYVDRFFATKGATKSSDIELNEVSIEDEDEGATELDATIVVVNGRASNEVQAMSEYRPSGLVDGQGLAIFWDDEFKMHLLVVFDGDPDDGLATDLIYAKEDTGETPQKSSSGGACATGAAAVVAIAALAMMKRRKK